MPIINDAPNVASEEAWAQLEPAFWSRVTELLFGHLREPVEAAQRVRQFRDAIDARPAAEKVLLLHIAPETLAQRLAEEDADAADHPRHN